jgi:hypothetical protein
LRRIPKKVGGTTDRHQELIRMDIRPPACGEQRGVRLMKITALILGSCALLALPTHSAGAGQCTGEIDSMAKILSAHDAGSGPTPGTASSGMGQHPPTVAMNQADQGGAASSAAAQSGRPQHPPTAAMNRETTGMASPSTGAEGMKEEHAPTATMKEEHPPTATMNQATQGMATSPQDVQRQNQGQPPMAQDQIAQSHSLVGATAALARARLLHQQGKEADCLSAIGQAKLMTGMR